MDDLLLLNAAVLTLDPQRPRADAVLLSGDRIRFVGHAAEARVQARPGAAELDLGGRTVVPGFNDNHLHALSTGEMSSVPNLYGRSCGEIPAILREHYAGAPPGELIVAQKWDTPFCARPHRSLLDPLFPANPVALFQFSGHAVWVNSLLLRRLGIDRDTPDPPGGTIERDASGEPTGLLRDTAARPVHWLRARRNSGDPRLRRRFLRKALELFGQAGLTSVQDNTWVPAVGRELARLRREGDLTCRFSCWAYGQRPAQSRRLALLPYDPLWVRRGPWKYFMDGTFSTRSAWMTEPYRGEPDNFGTPTWSLEAAERAVRVAARRGRQLAFHAIGDRAVHELLNCIERVSRRFPRVRELRLRVEHAQMILPGDIPRLRALGVLVAAQPAALSQPEKDEALLGPARARQAYPLRALLDEGVGLSFGSDSPSEMSLDPLEGMHLAVNRPAPQRLTPLEALSAYTLGSAHAEFMEGEKGSLTAGKLADLTVLSGDPTAVPPGHIRELRVEMTIAGGRVVWRREGEG